MSWKKGEVFDDVTPHRWIGIMYHLTPLGAIMRLPPAFVTDLEKLLEPLCKFKGTVAMETLSVIIGKAARVAHVVPGAKPFVAGLWGALAEVQRLQRREAPPGRVATRRFCYSAAWLRALLREDTSCTIELERLVSARKPAPASTSGWRVEFDASVYGGGAVLRDPLGVVREYFATVWQGNEAEHLHVELGLPKHQTFWEFATLLLALLVWG